MNLHGSGLSKVKLLSTLPYIKKLILSFNELTTMSDLGGIVSNGFAHKLGRVYGNSGWFPVMIDLHSLKSLEKGLARKKKH